MDWQIEDQHIIIRCGSHLDKESIQDQREIFIKVLAAKKPIIFYANDITKVDTAGLQLVLSFTLAASKHNIAWEWREPSSVLMREADLLGMRNLLKLPDNR